MKRPLYLMVGMPLFDGRLKHIIATTKVSILLLCFHMRMIQCTKMTK